MAFCTSEYFETVGSIQKSIHEREKRRHELEEELFTYSRSEERLARLKCTKMRQYHKELCKREQQAKTRNLELLRSAESLVLKAKEFSVDYTVLHHLKQECKNRIARLPEEGKMRERKKGLETQKQEQSRSLSLSTGRTSSQPAITLMGWQPLKDTLVEDGIMSSHSLIEPKPNHPSSSLLQSSPLMNAPISKPSGNKSLSDDILNSNDFPERQLVCDCDSCVRKVEVCGSEQLASTHVTLKASGVCSHHGNASRPQSSVSLQHHPSQCASPDTTHTAGSSVSRNNREQAEPESAQQRHTPIPDQSKSRSSSIGSSDAEVTPELSLNSSRDVSVSLGDSLHEQHKPIKSVTPIHEREKSKTGVETGEPLFPKPEHRLSMEEFFYLLDSIEERLPARDTELYSSSAVSEQKLGEIISLCSQRGELRGEELSVCGAVVLQQLPWLLWNTPHGCLLHSDLVNIHWFTAVDPAHIRSCLSGDSVALWERWFTHALQLLQQEVLSLNSIVQLFTPLLVHYSASYADKAEVLLKRLLTHVAETHHSAESEDSSSCSLPSLLNDSAEIKLARPSKKSISSAGTRGEQSDEEDSTNQSPVESIPIRETKAYQLLKQSVTQEKQWQNTQKEEEEDGSDLEPSGLSDNEKTGSSKRLIQDLRSDSKKKTQAFSAVQSKAFWGESDDTNSDIEMALRPQSRNTNNSDFDDFYD
ncbi:centrosomal protein kizuna isoform X1 [Pangasianodon hypophthalmus]|uniref:centrosomal protein kizuna isoform X1 n=1 Tax=Pangasianodon hypophthalmus TaxID=310915 RepID=UPI00230704F2|nr:centrosomal protein kizuna isoform X1 [Pangasianodon hypophthalmus]